MMRMNHLVLLLVLSIFLMGSTSCSEDPDFGWLVQLWNCTGQNFDHSNFENMSNTNFLHSKSEMLSSGFSMAIFSENTLLFIKFDDESFSQREISNNISFLRDSIEPNTTSLVLSNIDFKNGTNLSQFSHFTSHFQIGYIYINKIDSIHNANSLDVSFSFWHYNTGIYIATLSFPAYFIENYSLLFFSGLVDDFKFDKYFHNINPID